MPRGQYDRTKFRRKNPNNNKLNGGSVGVTLAKVAAQNPLNSLDEMFAERDRLNEAYVSILAEINLRLEEMGLEFKRTHQMQGQEGFKPDKDFNKAKSAPVSFTS